MTNDELRDTLAIEIAKILLAEMLEKMEVVNDLVDLMACSYPLADAVLSQRSVSNPVIAKCENTK